MPASKRRRAYARAVVRARDSTAGTTPAEIAAATPTPAAPLAAVPSRRRRFSLRPAKPVDGASTAEPARAGRASRAISLAAQSAASRTRPATAAPAALRRPGPSTAADPDDERSWGRVGLLVLLSLVILLQMVIGLVLHVATTRYRPVLVDVFYFNTLLVLPGCVVLMPLAKRLTHQHRTLRFLESLSFGALYAIFALLLTTAFLPVPHTRTTDAGKIIDQLTTGNVPGLALGDVLALLAAVQIYPGLNRLLSAPGRRARRRMLARNQPSASSARGSRAGTGTKPAPPRRR